MAHNRRAFQIDKVGYLRVFCLMDMIHRVPFVLIIDVRMILLWLVSLERSERHVFIFCRIIPIITIIMFQSVFKRLFKLLMIRFVWYTLGGEKRTELYDLNSTIIF